MIQPMGTQSLEGTSSIADADGDAEEISELTVEGKRAPVAHV